MGALEQHGPHLPVSTDAELADGIVARASEELPADLPVILLPTQVVAASEEHRSFAGTVSIRGGTLLDHLMDVASGLAEHGIRRWVIFNTHGGNKSVVDEAALRARAAFGLLVVKAHSFRFPVPEAVELPTSEWRHGLHGGAVETAMMLHLRPDLVRKDLIQRFPSLGEELDSELDVLLPEGPAAFAWLSQDLNPQGVTGDATLGTPALGARLVEGYGRFLASVVTDAARFPVDRLGPSP
jgi:creatinine amidohydrolase